MNLGDRVTLRSIFVNRRIPNGTYGGVRGRGLGAPSYSIRPLKTNTRFFANAQNDRKVVRDPSHSLRMTNLTLDPEAAKSIPNIFPLLSPPQKFCTLKTAKILKNNV